MLCTTLRADLTRGLMDCLCKALGITNVQVYSDALVEKNLGLAPGHTEQQRCVRMRACVMKQPWAGGLGPCVTGAGHWPGRNKAAEASWRL